MIIRVSHTSGCVPGLCGDLVLYGGTVYFLVLHVDFLVPRTFRWLLDFWKICALLPYIVDAFTEDLN